MRIRLIVFTALLFCIAAVAADHKPNVLYVIADMQRPQSMGCYGDTNAHTPNLDKFAKQGLQLNTAISATPVCCPYRAALMSGQCSHHNGMLSNGCKYAPTAKTMGETFRDAGYEMGYLGKWHLGNPKKDGHTWGFPEPDTEYGIYTFDRSPAPTTDIGLKFIAEKSKADKPWFLVVSWIMPHEPYAAPKGYAEHFPKPSIRPNVPAGKPHDFAEKNMPDYYGMIEKIDEEFGRLMKALDEAGVAKDTIVIFSSDHGDMIGSQGYKAKRWPYEESARIPYLIRYPGAFKPGLQIDNPFSIIDAYPTIAGLAGLRASPKVDGQDFSAFFTGKVPRPPRDFVYLEMPYAFVPWPGWRAIRTEDMMYARMADKPWLLYNVKNDPYETNNLISDSTLTKQWDDRLTAAMKQYGDSWSEKATTGDIDQWLPGANKQASQNLGVPYPGEVRTAFAKGKAKAGKKKKKAAAESDQ
jgi:arylsulfatase A-like enzyme